MTKTNPTTLLTGFLGAGKTSLLNHIIGCNPARKYAVIENEFGKENIDSKLVFRGESDIIELNDGCLCCTLNDNLYDILNDLYDRRGEFDELIIEATGVADPVGLAAPFMLNPAIKKQFPLSRIICLVDCEQIEDLLSVTEEAKKQIAYSDVIVLNKLDLVSESYVQHLHARLQLYNPLAQIVRGIKAAYPITSEKNRPIGRLLPFDGTDSKTNDHFPVQNSTDHFPHRHTSELSSLAFKFSDPFSSQELQHRLLVFLTFQAKNIYRMKGIVSVRGEEEQMIIQSVGNRFSVDKGRQWLDGLRESVIVFIGKDLQEAGLRKMLETCFATKEQHG